MALQQCNECGGQVSGNASACPHCGAPTPKTQFKARSTSAARVILMVVGLLLIVPIVGMGQLPCLAVPGVLILLALLLK